MAEPERSFPEGVEPHREHDSHNIVRWTKQTDPKIFFRDYPGSSNLKAEVKRLTESAGMLFEETDSIEPLKELLAKAEAREDKTPDQVKALEILDNYIKYVELHIPPVITTGFPRFTSEVTSVAEDPVPEELDESAPEDTQPTLQILEDLSTEELEEVESVIEGLEWQPKSAREFDLAAAAEASLRAMAPRREQRQTEDSAHAPWKKREGLPLHRARQMRSQTKQEWKPSEGDHKETQG